MNRSEKQDTISYSGIFLSYFSQNNTKCIHSIPVHSLNFVCSGEQIVDDGNNKIVIKAGEAVFVRRNHRTKIYKNSINGECYQGIALTFDKDVLRDFYKKLDKATIPQAIDIKQENVFKVAERADIKSLFHSLMPYFDENVKPTDAVANLKLLEGIHALLNTSDIFYKVLFDFVDPWKIDLIEFLDNYYMDDLTMKEIAAHTGRSLATFKRDFKKISNLSPQKWIMKKRLEIAYTLLKEDKKKIQEVYMEVGFKNPSHFSTAFKNQFGTRPTELV